MPAYMIALAVCMGLQAVNRTFPGKNGLLLTWLMYAFEALLYVLGIYLGIHPSPDTPTVSFIAFLLAVPLLFVMRPIQHILNVVFFDGIFILTCFLFKSKETLPVDILDGVVFGAVSCIISTFIMLSMHENFSIRHKLLGIAETDLNVGLKNRNAYESQMRDYPMHCSSTLSCVYLDVNGLHELNNTRGHAAGDEMLKTVAAKVRDIFGEEYSYRVGGDEFVAFAMDKLLRRIGLSGRSIVPMLIGFGCTVPGVMASRTLPSERDRKMTILLTPFMSCSAKLPIYSLFAVTFFPEYAALVMVGLYFLGILVGIGMAFLLKGTLFKGEAVPFVMELPNYRLPGLKNVAQLLWEKARDFLERAFTVIFLATIIIWFLQNFDFQLSLTADPQESILAWIASGIAPLFAPLGFGDWRVSTALITGFMAKESVVSTLTILYGSAAALGAALSPAAAAPLLVFCLLYTPCIAAVASVKREMGGRWATVMVVNQCVVAWLAALVVRFLAVAVL